MTRAAGGFTLVELLVALALAGLLLGGVLGAAAGAARRHGELQDLALLQERGQQALGLLEPELQLAGFGGLSALASLPWSGTPPAAVRSCGTFGLPPRPLRVDAMGYALGCPAEGGGASPTSHVVTVMRASARLGTPESGRLQLVSSRRAEATQGLIANGQLPAGTVLREGVDEVRDLVLITFYVARNAQGAPGLPALRMKELTSIAGRPALRDVEVLAGVEDLCIEPASPSSVRVSVRLRSERRLQASPPREFTCGSRNESPRDGFAREEVSRTFALRNRSAEPS